MNIFLQGGQINENFCQGLGWAKNEHFFTKAGKKMNIFLQGGQKNENFIQSPGWAKK